MAINCIRVCWNRSTILALVGSKMIVFNKNRWMQPLSELAKVHFWGLYRNFFIISFALSFTSCDCILEIINVVQVGMFFSGVKSTKNFFAILFLLSVIISICSLFSFERELKTAEYVEFCFNKFFNVCFFIFISTFSVRRKWLVVIFKCIGKFYLEPILHSVHLSGLFHQYSIILYAKHKALFFLQQRKDQNWTNDVKKLMSIFVFPSVFCCEIHVHR